MAKAKTVAEKYLSNRAAPQAPERRFYSRTKAFGRFGMRIFKPELMNQPHWHGHVEGNYIRNARMIYVVDGQRIVVEPDRMVVFWAGIPHQLVGVEPVGDGVPELANIYLPLDTFLYMSHIPDLQVALLTGGMIILPEELCTAQQLRRWYADYRANEPERLDVLKMDLHALLRRVSLGPLPFLKRPWHQAGAAQGADHSLTSPHVRHVVAMVRHVLENIHEPLRNADVTQVTGLHSNYALSLFSRTMAIPLKQFIIRMRLLRARGMLLESDMAISTVAVESGFGSASQFYAHFNSAYGQSPQQLRDSYLASAGGRMAATSA
ncbi:MAG: helix-turn-helix domain-containing protein [Hyphomicrobiales bacterium]